MGETGFWDYTDNPMMRRSQEQARWWNSQVSQMSEADKNRLRQEGMCRQQNDKYTLDCGTRDTYGYGYEPYSDGSLPSDTYCAGGPCNSVYYESAPDSDIGPIIFALVFCYSIMAILWMASKTQSSGVLEPPKRKNHLGMTLPTVEADNIRAPEYFILDSQYITKSGLPDFRYKEVKDLFRCKADFSFNHKYDYINGITVQSLIGE